MNHAKRVIPMSDSSVSIKPEDIQPTVLPDAFIQSDIVRKLNTLSLPRYDQLPNVTLYRDQVIEYVALWMEPLSICVEQPIITPSMINNYVKVGLVPAPVKKQYGREQIARLIAICIFKQVLPTMPRRPLIMWSISSRHRFVRRFPSSRLPCPIRRIR